jgi:transposase
VLHAFKTTALVLAKRVQALDAELSLLDAQIEPLVKATAPALLNVYGVGFDTAAVLLTAAGDNATRIHSEAAWAKLCGAAPIPIMTGKTSNGRYRLNPGGNHHANNALWRIVLTRLGQREPRTVAYMNRRLAEGKTKPEIFRCLKRYVARETFRALPR